MYNIEHGYNVGHSFGFSMQKLYCYPQSFSSGTGKATENLSAIQIPARTLVRHKQVVSFLLFKKYE